MNSNAPGQLLGYSIQYPRALCHLLRGGPETTVCIEVLGDVATVSKTGNIIAEEDKSSINSNPVTDRSIDLWKTFSNWVDLVKQKKFKLASTTFILFRNQEGDEGIVNTFDKARNSTEATSALEAAKEKLKDLDSKHAAWRYYKNAVLDNSGLLTEIIARFQLETGVGAGFDEVHAEIIKKMVPASQISFLTDNLHGWLLKVVSEKIAAKLPAEILWEDFNKQFIVFFDRARKLELIDFALVSPPDESEVTQQVKIRPLYLKQLELINSSDDELVEAVTDYLRAKINRYKWIEADFIDESTASDFELKLSAFWKNTLKKIQLTHSGKSSEQIGQLLLIECKCRQELIRDMSPPASTITGTYHELANVPSIGWHPEWSKLSKDWKLN